MSEFNRDYAAPIASEAAGAAFDDTWTLSDVDVAWIGLFVDQEPALAAVIEADGLAHSEGWRACLAMMAVRLLELKRLPERARARQPVVRAGPVAARD